MFPLRLDAKLLNPAGAVEKLLALAPILLALATGVIALLQALNGLQTETVVETLIFGWLLATPIAALVLWPLPDAVPVPDLGNTVDRTDEADADDPVQVLRDRYAAGDVDQAEFERRLDDLLATEGASVGDAATGRPGPADGASDRVAETE